MPNSPEKDATVKCKNCGDPVFFSEGRWRDYTSGELKYLNNVCNSIPGIHEPTEKVTLGGWSRYMKEHGKEEYEKYDKTVAENPDMIQREVTLGDGEPLAWPPKYWQCPNDESHSLEWFPRWTNNMRCKTCHIKPVLKHRPSTPPTAGASETGLPPLDVRKEDTAIADTYRERSRRMGLTPGEDDWHCVITFLKCRERQLLTAQAERDAAIADATALRGEVERLSSECNRLATEIEMREASLFMTLSRLGGLVEGRPPGRHNLLQRIDELRGIEAELAQLKAGKGGAE